MKDRFKSRIGDAFMAFAGAVFALSCVGMMHGIEPFFTWFYVFAWWSYILFLESFLWVRGGESELFVHPRKFVAFLPLSVVVWLIFEVFNFRLGNWHYLQVPADRMVRWFGYTVSFATVLPGLRVTKNLQAYLHVGEGHKGHAFRQSKRMHGVLAGIGIFCLAAPVIGPQFFFPLVWIGFVFILEPLNYHFQAPSLLRDLEGGTYTCLFQWLLAGLCCGLLWESWNFWAGAKWYYTIPFVGFLKLFEMPVLGFLGFLPFAVEAYVMTNTACLLEGWIARRESTTGRIALWVVLVLCFCLFSWFVFAGIDRYTVATFRP